VAARAARQALGSHARSIVLSVQTTLGAHASADAARPCDRPQPEAPQPPVWVHGRRESSTLRRSAEAAGHQADAAQPVLKRRELAFPSEADEACLPPTPQTAGTQLASCLAGVVPVLPSRVVVPAL